MREILFRGKRTDNGEWVEGYYSNLGGNHPRILKDNIFIGKRGMVLELENIKVLPETVGQYTGLTDKNGKKIFEGDIVRAFTRFSEIYVSPVAYHDGTFWFKNWSWTKFLFKFEKIEVIGNIHDNPELLKVW